MLTAIPGENSDNSLNNNENNEKSLRKSDLESFDYTEKNASPGIAAVLIRAFPEDYKSVTMSCFQFI